MRRRSVAVTMGSNPTVTAMETPEKSGVFPYPGSGVVHFRCVFRLEELEARGSSDLVFAIWVNPAVGTKAPASSGTRRRSVLRRGCTEVEAPRSTLINL